MRIFDALKPLAANTEPSCSAAPCPASAAAPPADGSRREMRSKSPRHADAEARYTYTSRFMLASASSRSFAKTRTSARRTSLAKLGELLSIARHGSSGVEAPCPESRAAAASRSQISPRTQTPASCTPAVAGKSPYSTWQPGAERAETPPRRARSFPPMRSAAPGRRALSKTWTRSAPAPAARLSAPSSGVTRARSQSRAPRPECLRRSPARLTTNRGDFKRRAPNAQFARYTFQKRSKRATKPKRRRELAYYGI